MTDTVRQSNKAAILAVGEELRVLLHEEDPPMIKDRRFHLRTYSKSFIGSEMVDWLLKKGEVESRNEAVQMMQKLVDYGVLHHVCDDHTYKDEFLFYRFRRDDGTYEEPADTAILAKGQRLYTRMKGDGSQLIQDRKYHLKTYKECFVGKEFVDWLIAKGEARNRVDAVDLGKHLVEAGVIGHVVSDHNFKDEFLFYRFKYDQQGEKSKKIRDRLRSRTSSKRSSTRSEDDAGSSGSIGNRGSGSSWGSGDNSPQTNTPELEEYVQMQSHQVGLKQPSPLPPRYTPSPQPNISTPPPPAASVRSNGAAPTAVNTQLVRPSTDELADPDKYDKRKVDVVSDPVGYGFVIRGSRPVYVHSVDPNGPAAAAGLKEGEYLFSVNGQNVLNASHTDAARIILMGTSTAFLVTLVPKDN